MITYNDIHEQEEIRTENERVKALKALRDTCLASADEIAQAIGQLLAAKVDYLEDIPF